MTELLIEDTSINPVIKDRIEKIQHGIVPEGYKETSVGIIPDNWEIKTIDDIRDQSNSHSFTGGPFGSNLKVSDYTEGGVRVLQLQNIGDGRFLNKHKIFTSIAKADELKSCNIYPGEILIAKMAEPLARACIVPNHEKRYLMASDGIRLKPDKKYNVRIITEIINTKKFRRIAEARGTGTTRKRISLGDLRTIPMAIPSEVEQQKIADILSTWDQAIELKEVLIKEKEEQKIGYMQNLLKPKYGWKETRLGDLSKIVTGTTPPTSYKEYYDGEYPWITPTDIKREKYLYTSERNLTKKGLEKGRFVPKDSLLITCIASIGKNAILKKDGSCNQQINAIYPSTNHSNEFMYYLITHNTRKLLRYAATTATAIINKQTFENISFLIPPLEEQNNIAGFLSTIDKEISLLNQELDLLKEQKKGLMQLLLTGIVRVEEVEKLE